MYDEKFGIDTIRLVTGAYYISESSITTITFSIPNICKLSLGCVLERAWPGSGWVGGQVTIAQDYTFQGVGKVDLISHNSQSYDINLDLVYKF